MTLQTSPITYFFKKTGARHFIIGNLWTRNGFLRRAFFDNALSEVIPGRERRRAIVRTVDPFMKSLQRDFALYKVFSPSPPSPAPPAGEHLSRKAAVPDTRGVYHRLETARDHLRSAWVRFRGQYMVPSREFRDRLRDCLMGPETGEDERYFTPDELLDAEKDLKHEHTKHRHEDIFGRDGKKKWRSLFSDHDNTRPVPEAYIKYFFDKFNAPLFIQRGVSFSLSGKKEFTAAEVLAAIDALSSRIFLRDPGNLVQSSIPPLKAVAIAIVILWYAIPLSIDLVLLAYGLTKNDYYFGSTIRAKTIGSIDSPLARRAIRVYRMNREIKKNNFKISGHVPYQGRPVKINPKSRCAVELSYSAYRHLRIQDQNGCTILAIDDKRINSMDDAQRRAFVDAIIEKTAFEKMLSFLDTHAGTGLFKYRSIPHSRLRDDLMKKITESPAPLRWIRKLDNDRGIVNVIYHKPNTMKWSRLGDIPPLMIEALILLEDRRFRNDLFPLPHRGNDHMVIIPQIWKKIAEAYLRSVKRLGTVSGIGWLEWWSDSGIRAIKHSFRGKDRGGSSLSNQLMEMLYTKYIVSNTPNKSFEERQVEQKKYELPASAMLDWFWTENDILEAYVNEVFGGHLYSDIRGLKSQAEMYFQRDLGNLSIREQFLLIAAIKKPSLIKEYAYWRKAMELADLIGDAGTRRDEVLAWEENNKRYGVHADNYREILQEKDLIGRWIENRIKAILHFLLHEGRISESEYLGALRRETISFDYNPGVFIADPRLANNIKREIDSEIGHDRSDSGLIVCTTIDPVVQKALQSVINGASRTIFVNGDERVEGQPSNILVGGGARIIRAHRESPEGKINVLNRIIADVGGSSSVDDEWDWVTQANRSLGSSLKPLLDLYFNLLGYNLNDSLKNSKITYNTYTLEQRRIYENYILKHPGQQKDIDEIEKNWLWTPKNYQVLDDEWITVREALVRSINIIHVKIQELVTPAAFAEMLNDTMNIVKTDERHKPYRSIILGGSSGDQRYDKFLLAYSIIPNFGMWQKHTYINVIRHPDGTLIKPAYKCGIPRSLARFSPEKVSAACTLMNHALREIVKRGTMHGIGGIGAGKTGTSNEMRDALATVHFKSGNDIYIAGVRLGNTNNYSLGRAADRFAVPVLREIVKKAFDEDRFGQVADFDGYIQKKLSQNAAITRVADEYYLRGGEYRSRHLNVEKIKEEKKEQYFDDAMAEYEKEHYREAAALFEEYLALADHFAHNSREFTCMVNSFIKIKDLERAQTLIEHFSPPGRISAVARKFEKEHGVNLVVDKDFYATGTMTGKERKSSSEREHKLKKNGKKAKVVSDTHRKQRLIDYAKEFVEKLEGAQ